MAVHMRLIPKWQGIRNGSDRPQRLVDRLLPDGGITLQPGETTSIPRVVWRRHMYRCQLWMRNTDVIAEPPVAEDIDATGDAPAEPDGILACPICDRPCKGNVGLSAHMRAKHPVEETDEKSDDAAATRPKEDD